jgi:plasmid maintenance system killer protein
MEVVFDDTALAMCFEKQAKARERWPHTVAEKFALRIRLLQIARCRGDLMILPTPRLQGHQRKRKRCWAMDLTGGWRLMLDFGKANGIDVIRVLEVEQYE